MMSFACTSLGILAGFQAGGCKGPWIHKCLHNWLSSERGGCVLLLTKSGNRVPK